METPEINPQLLATKLSGVHLIDGALVSAQSGRTFAVINPATGETFAQAAAGDAGDVGRAVASAKAAQPAWAAIRARERGKLLMECGRRLAGHVEELGRLTALETGKALRTESRVEASVLADTFIYYGGLTSELKGETIPFSPDMLAFTIRQPIGVVAAIIPWNAPLLLMALKIAPALAAGNTVVVKSAEEAPLGVLRIAQLFAELLPPGVFNLISGDGPSAGAPLAAHPDVAKLTFTGSVETGRIVYRAAAEKLIPVTLELGGKSPMIVMPDADIPRAVAGAISGMRFTRQGQSCTAASRMLVHESVHDAFVAGLISAVDAMKMGDPLDDATDIGAVISRGQLDTVQRYIAMGRAIPEATVHECSALPDDPRLKNGLFVRPHIFTDVPHDHAINQQEIFGPVTCVHRFRDYEEALTLANDCEFGLAATIWTRDLATAMDAVHRLEAGFVQVNQNLVVQPMLSYGGIKKSGIGKEASLEAMLEHFTSKKTVLINMR
jgi:acyl-CoA reductase-like NAD-dependent aldehyde dehydrogenase